jgi:hypothetical protein
LNAVRQVAGDRKESNSAFNCVAVGGDPRTIGFEIVHFGLHRDEVSTVGRGVLLTPLDSGQRELLGSLLGLSGINGRLGRGCIGSALLLALVLGELPVFYEEKETRTAGVGLFVGPLVHAKFALRVNFLPLLNQLAEVFSGFTPNLQIDEGRHLLLLALRVVVVLVVGDARGQNRFAARGISQFRVSGDITGDEDFVDVHWCDLGFDFVVWYQFRRFKYATSSISFQEKISFIFDVSRSIREACGKVYNIISNR